MSDSGTSPAEPRKIPFWRTIYESFLFVFTNLRRVLVIGWLPFIIIAAADYLETAHYSGYVTFSPAITIPNDIVSWLAFALFAVSWHRFVILGKRRSAAAGLLARRNFIYLGYFVVLIGGPVLAEELVVEVLARLAGQLPPWRFVGGRSASDLFPVFTLGVAVLILMLMRFYLVFPAAAIDRPMKAAEAYLKIHGNTWRLICATLLITVIFSLPYHFLRPYVGEEANEAILAKVEGVTFEAVLAAYVIVLSVAYFLMTAVLVTIQSKFYVHIMGAPQREAADAS